MQDFTSRGGQKKEQEVKKMTSDEINEKPYAMFDN